LLTFGAESFVFQITTPPPSKKKKKKIKITIILPVVLNGCETWSLTLREKCRLRVFENNVLRRILEVKTEKVKGSEENYIKKYIMRSLMICIPYPLLCR
jgi:hypothetical protein